MNECKFDGLLFVDYSVALSLRCVTDLTLSYAK